jgi:hypothetical protein
MAALILLINLMFGGSSTLTADQAATLKATPEYQSAYSEDPTAAQAIVIVDTNEL